MMDLAALVPERPPWSPGFLDEVSKRAIRRAALTAVAVPGHQVPFASREMPVARGWGSGGLQVTLAMAGADDVVKVIDQGDDGGVNAANLRRLISTTTKCQATADTTGATIIQTRHRIPETPMRQDQTLVLQVPVPEPLRAVERNQAETRRMHAESDYGPLWVGLYEDIVKNGIITNTTGYPCLVNDRYVISTTPIPRWDVAKLNEASFLSLFGAGREKRIYAIPPHTSVVPLTFDDVPFETERVDETCRLCGASGLAESFLVESAATGSWVCSDTDHCSRRSGHFEDVDL